MISRIEIDKIATFQDVQLLDKLNQFNYFFGANGSGKTTISRVIASPSDYPACSVNWENQVPLETCVYNRDFVDQNFNQQNLKGIFTLGKTAKETTDAISVAKGEIKTLQDEINGLANTLHGADRNGGKEAELAQLERTYKSKFFVMKQKHADKMAGEQSGEGMKGFIGSQDSFMSKVLRESESNTATLLSQSEIEEVAASIFSNTLATVEPLSEISTTEMLQHEENLILRKHVIGKEDVDIAAMILKLNNSDWVRQGLSFYDTTDGVCPFCQQITNEDFRKSLLEYFDETFMRDSNEIKSLIDSYSADAYRLQTQIQILIDSQSTFLDIEKLRTEKRLLDSIIEINKQRLLKKQRESSQTVTLDSHANVLSTIAKIIATANAEIAKNNHILSNLKDEKAILTDQIWKFVISELATDITTYKRERSHLERAIDSINEQIKLKNIARAKIEDDLRKLEKQITSIIPTRDGINHLLEIFGFKSFKIELGEETNTYKLVREDGSGATNTLSEGERSFLTFLYFYHLLKGSQSEASIENDKVIVIDDPISSLDNDVLFIVSTLIRELIEGVRESNGPIKQIFILTHNIYFHKEVTFNKRRNNCMLAEETFWIVKKNQKNSTVERQTCNPIKTSYELLWDEVRSDTRNNATIQNTLRRILENYFKLLGNIPLDKLYMEFEGEDKIKCKALCSWVNDGSHSSFNEEFYTPLDAAMVDKFLEIFREIFQAAGHISHYNMMMGINHEVEDVAITKEIGL